MLQLDAKQVLQAQHRQLERPAPPAPHQPRVVELVRGHRAVPGDLQHAVRPAPRELALLQRHLDPLPPSARIADVARQDGGQGAGVAEADAHDEELQVGAQAAIVRAPAPAHPKAAAGLPRGVREQLHRSRQIQKLRQLRTRGGLAVDHHEAAADALVAQLRPEGPHSLAVLHRVEIRGVRPQHQHRPLRGALERPPQVDLLAVADAGQGHTPERRSGSCRRQGHNRGATSRLRPTAEAHSDRARTKSHATESALAWGQLYSPRPQPVPSHSQIARAPRPLQTRKI
mmetsp:Transcript_102327/g.318756  ORF Transcript_102327/g.318756 Transcript_102327/m.318756 type:complete len:286 (+) Transcript_102327:370-1227(+)